MYGIVIGRFQPFHNAHLKLIKTALENSKKVIVVLGSSSQIRTVKNPWTSSERKKMISLALSSEELKRIHFIDLKDFSYNDNLWLTTLQQKVNEISDGNKVKLFGHDKDKSTYYLSLFPQWGFVETGENLDIDATRCRKYFFEQNMSNLSYYIPEKSFSFLIETMDNTEFRDLQIEYEYVLKYKQMWESSPFPPTFVTVDAVVIKSGHVLVVRRKGHPGKGAIALPGGFIGQDEYILDSCIRELKEETGIRIDRAELKKRIIDNKVFDNPNRSLRGRTITHAFCLDLGHGELPLVKGNDDADKAWWMPLSDVYVKEENFYEDHFHIINHFISKF